MVNLALLLLFFVRLLLLYLSYKGNPKEITLNLIKAGLNNETISKATGLSTEQIESLRQKQ